MDYPFDAYPYPDWVYIVVQLIILLVPPGMILYGKNTFTWGGLQYVFFVVYTGVVAWIGPEIAVACCMGWIYPLVVCGLADVARAWYVQRRRRLPSPDEPTGT